MRMFFVTASLVLAWSTVSLADTCEETDAGYRCFLESDDAVTVLEGISLDELEAQWKIKIPKKIGGTVGEVIGKVTNPIKDNVTAPIAEAFNDVVFNQVVEVTDRLAKDNHGQDFDDCVPIIAAAAAAYGASVGGPLGAAIGAGAGVPAARITCRKIFP